jgi:homoserine acetyltransferase
LSTAVKLHHTVDGPLDGPVLLLGGSLGTTLEMWEPQVAALSSAIAAMDLRDGLKSVRTPALVVSGAQDPSIPPTRGRAIADAIPDSRFELLDPGAHLTSVERADAVNHLIDEFIRETR